MSGVNIFIEDYLPSKKVSDSTVSSVFIDDYLPKADGKTINNININEVPIGDAKSYFDLDNIYEEYDRDLTKEDIVNDKRLSTPLV